MCCSYVRLFYTTTILFVQTSALESNIKVSVNHLNPCSLNDLLGLLLNRLPYFVHFKVRAVGGGGNVAL
jgi:hypothetical protein